jgi:uncharacterized iron-regulated membrane protein
MSAWQQWVRHPEKLWVRKCIFYIHLWVGVAAGLYIVLMSITGSLIVYRNELDTMPSIAPSVEWIVDLHENLLSGANGRFVNGMGAICVILLSLSGAVVWWPGIDNWRRALIVNWRSFFARFTWDLHSALGFWSFPFVLMWGITGFYFCFPQAANVLSRFVDPRDRYADVMLDSLSMFHFGRFNWVTKAVWSLLGLLPSVLSLTGVFLCCRRMIYKVPPSRP